MAYISLEHVVKRYKMGEVTITAVDDITFDIEKGEFVIIVGPSGAGKTTVLNILGGMDACDEGTILVDGKEISKCNSRQLTTYRRYDIGFVFQFYNLIQNLTALENVELAAQICKEPLPAQEVLCHVGLGERLNNFPAQLSGGEQQRVTMTRMVEEQRVAIGGMKALGYSKGAIAIKYVGYGFLASAVGSLVGLAVGLTLLPWIICTSWKIIYTFGPIHYGIEPVTSVTACLAAVGTVTLSALGACFNTLAAVPAQLMRPKAPPMGKRILLERITPLWRRLSFNYKITLRNLFRYQKRFWMTVIGIGGCAALIVTAFGLRDSIFAVMEKQYEEIYRYSAQLGLVEHITPGEWAEVEKSLEGSELVGDWTKEHTETVTAETDAYTADATLEVVENSEVLERFVNLRHRTDNDTVTLPEDGVILTEKLSLLLDVEVGDTITLDGDSRVEVRVADITEHYIQHSVYMSSTYYEQVFGQTPEENAVLVSYDTQADGAQELEQKLVSLDGVSSLTRIEDTRKTFGTSLESVDYAVALIIVCAAALAFVVLYNLTNINITERMRELATLKVLGFYDGELSAYIYRENVILTVFGVAMGMVMGKFLHQWLILTVEIDLLMFGRTVAPTSYLWAVLLTTVFSLVVNLAAHRKLKKLDMVESLKTVE